MEHELTTVVALLRWRNIWLKIAVLRNSHREAGCVLRNTRLFFPAADEKKKKSRFFRRT